MREYLKSLFDRHQTLDRQRRGSALSRDDRVRLQYSPVRLAEVLVLNAIASTRGDNAAPNQKTGPNDKNAGEDCDESGTTAVLQEETFDEELSCEEFSAQKGEDANALAGVCFLDEKEEDNHTRATSAESLSDLLLAHPPTNALIDFQSESMVLCLPGSRALLTVRIFVD